MRPHLRNAHACRIDGLIKAKPDPMRVSEIAERLSIHRGTVAEIITEPRWGHRITRTSTVRSCGTQQDSIAQFKQRQPNTQALQSTLNSMLIEVNEKLNQRVTQLTFLVAAAFILSFAAALVLGGRHG